MSGRSSIHEAILPECMAEFGRLHNRFDAVQASLSELVRSIHQDNGKASMMTRLRRLEEGQVAPRSWPEVIKTVALRSPWPLVALVGMAFFRQPIADLLVKLTGWAM